MEAHDWRNLFNRFDLWGVDQMLSNIMFYLGWLSIFLAWVWLYKVGGPTPKRDKMILNT